MPWQECRKMDERLRFVARLLEGEKMAALCREFDISRQTGHKFYKRYKDGPSGPDRSLSATLPPGQPPTRAGGVFDRSASQRAPQLGCSEDPREDQAPGSGSQSAGHQYRACGA